MSQPSLGIHPRAKKACVPKKTFTHTFRAALFTIVKNWTRSKVYQQEERETN